MADQFSSNSMGRYPRRNPCGLHALVFSGLWFIFVCHMSGCEALVRVLLSQGHVVDGGELES